MVLFRTDTWRTPNELVTDTEWKRNYGKDTERIRNGHGIHWEWIRGRCGGHGLDMELLKGYVYGTVADGKRSRNGT